MKPATPRRPSPGWQTKVSGVFVPVVIVIAIVTAVVWLIAGMGFEFALSNAISVLVISHPAGLLPVALW